MIAIDLARARSKLRKESILYRRLLQMRDFFVGDRDKSASNIQQKVVEEGIAQSRSNIELLEAGLLTGLMEQMDANR
jgi:hypothetical protein